MASTLASRKQAIFRSVFQTDISQPTPYSTPSLRFVEHGQAFGGPAAVPHSLLSSPRRSQASGMPAGFTSTQDDQVRWDRSWHTVTAHIQLPPSVAAEDSFGPLGRESQETDSELYEALRVVLHPQRRVPQAAHTEDILAWHTQQVRHHFIQHVLPLLSACGGNNTNPRQVLLGSMHTLEAAHRQYLYGLCMILRGMDEGDASAAMSKFRRDLHAMIGNTMTPGLVDALRAGLTQLTRTALGVPQGGEKPSNSDAASAGSELVVMAESLYKVGLGGERFQVLFAEVMDTMMREFVVAMYAGRWSFRGANRNSSGSYCTNHLDNWVVNHFSRLAVEVLGQLDGAQVVLSDVAKWKDIAMARLAALRIDELFDIVLQWPHSRDGLEDLRVSVTTPQRRLQLTDAFSETLGKRLLHPGCSTLRILQVYISMIKTFHALDHSKVLLDRVVQSLQLYLCQRDDAIRIVVAGLLYDERKASATADDTLVELAGMLKADPGQSQQSNADDDLDWDDMSWVPVPVDAAVNYKRPKSEDVIGTLIRALGSKDTFIKEFQNILAERLLWGPKPFTQEIAVLRLLRKRFGENALQNCEVMHRDIIESDELHPQIRQGLDMQVSADTSLPDVRLRILSRLFWPTLPREHFIIPQEITELQDRYEARFRGFKADRKLTWINNLGTAEVDLELQDRRVTLTCKTCFAAVIYAFGEEEAGEASGAPARGTIEELEEKLQMDTDLLEEALAFWMEKKVLRQGSEGTFVVIENLADDENNNRDEAAEESPTKAGAGSSDTPSRKPRRAMNAAEKEQRQVYWQFVRGMLTNSAASMPLANIAMMLKMLIPGGFPWSNEELQAFLGELVDEGELELAGGKYKLVKK